VNPLTRVYLSARPTMKPEHNGLTKATSWIKQVKKSYQCVNCLPSSRLVSVDRLNGKNSKGHQYHFKDSLSWISFLRAESRLNRVVRRPTALASNTIHLSGGMARSIEMFSTLPPPLYIRTLNYCHPRIEKGDRRTCRNVFLQTRPPVIVAGLQPTPFQSLSS